MMYINTIKTLRLYSLCGLAVLSAITISNASAQDRTLEEVVVTAQRREQSLQEVPVSIHAVSGVELTQQGFRQMQDLGNFAPSVEIAENLHDWSVTIRGMGNDVANLSIEQSAPIFVDGVNFGRPSMIKGAFIDIERVEVLTGPQPIAFGQNATAGAFSVVTRRPTPEWEADVTTEIGRWGRKTFEAAGGGPLTDTLGIRVAGKWDVTDGHLESLVDDSRFPYRREQGGRLTLQWNPTENFEATFKAGYAKRRSGGDVNAVCRGPSSDRALLFDGERAVLVRGLVPAYDALFVQEPMPNCITDGFTNVGVPEGGKNPRLPVPGLNNTDNRTGSINAVSMMRKLTPGGDLEGREPMRAWDFRLGLNYEFDNGVQLEAISGMVDYDRSSFEASDESPIIMEASYRTEVFDMWSQELRLTSPTGGTFEWTAGLYYHIEDLDLSPVTNVRGNVQWPYKLHNAWGESEWRSAFASVTFNFLDGKASIDAGGRYTDVEKSGYFKGLGATWIMDINPFAAPGNAPSTNPFNNVVRNAAAAMIDCSTGHPQCGSYRAGFWTHVWRSVDVPDAWNAREPVDIGPLLVLDPVRDSVFVQDDYAEDSFDPQVTLRYRPTENHSFYAKWARAFKAGGFDTSDRGPPDPEAFSFLAEHAENFEIGAKGFLFDQTLRYNVSIFNQVIKDLQVETEVIDLATIASGVEETGRAQTNAGKQRTRGVEFDLTWAATERLTAIVAGVIQEGVMLDFIAGCTEEEFANADTSGCWSAAESIDLVGSTAIAGFFDRAGYKAPRTPDFKFIFGLDYWHPVADGYKASINSKLAYSDDYTEDTLGFTRFIAWPRHADWNVLLGIGDMDDTWNVSVYGRNILGARQKYYPEYQINTEAKTATILVADMPESAFFTYGVQFSYHFR